MIDLDVCFDQYRVRINIPLKDTSWQVSYLIVVVLFFPVVSVLYFVEKNELSCCWVVVEL